jgi:hypothetical protein
VIGLRRISERRRLGLCAGVAVMRSGRGRMIALLPLAVCCSDRRSWLAPRGIRAIAAVLDTIAQLIAMFTAGQLPIGPSHGGAAAVQVLGAYGVAAACRCAADRHGHGWFPLLRRLGLRRTPTVAWACRHSPFAVAPTRA